MKLGLGRLPLLPRLRDGPVWPQRRYLGTAAAAAVAQEIPNKRRTGKRIPAHERKAMVEAYVDKYRVMNAGKFPTTKNVVGQIGGSYYKTKVIIQELEYKSKLPTVATAADNLPISEKAPLNRISDTKAIVDCKLENTMACETLFTTSMDDSELPAKPGHPCDVSGISRSTNPEEVDENSGQAFESDVVTRVTCVEEFSTLIDTKKQVSNPDSANVAKLDTPMMRNEENITLGVEKTLDCQVRVGRTATVDLYQVSAEDNLNEVEYHNCQRMMDAPILMKGKEVAVEDVCRSEETTAISAKATTTEDCDVFVMPSHPIEAPKTSQNTMISNDEASAPASKCDNIPRVSTTQKPKRMEESQQSSLWGNLKLFASNFIGRWQNR